MRLRRFLPLLCAAVLAWACSDDDPPSDATGTDVDLAAVLECDSPDAQDIPARICELFRDGPRRTFLARYGHSSIQFERGREAAARRHMLGTVGQMLKQIRKAKDPAGPTTVEEALASLIQDMLATVGIFVDDIPPEALSDGKVAVVTSAGGKFVTNNGFELVVFQEGSVDQDMLLVITPRDDGSDPLNTSFQQVPKYFDNTIQGFEESEFALRGPALAGGPPQFDPPVTVALCAVTDDLTEEEADALRLGHDVGSEGFEVLDPVAVPSGLDCDEAVDESSESLSLIPGAGESAALAGGKAGPGSGIALAGGRGVGGQVSSFSDFGAVIPEEEESATVEGIVFTDDNENGEFEPDSGEAAIDSALAVLSCGGEGGTQDETFSDGDGNYLFDTDVDLFSVGDSCVLEAFKSSIDGEYFGQTDEFEVQPGENAVDIPGETFEP